MADTKPEPIDDFVALSAILTGIAADKLRPQLDTHGTAGHYFDYATKHGGADFTHLMAVCAAHRNEGPETIAAFFLSVWRMVEVEYNAAPEEPAAESAAAPAVEPPPQT